MYSSMVLGVSLLIGITIGSVNVIKRRSTTQRRTNRKYLPIASCPAVVVGDVLSDVQCSIVIDSSQTRQV
jgi:hypothetical protein